MWIAVRTEARIENVARGKNPETIRRKSGEKAITRLKSLDHLLDKNRSNFKKIDGE